MKSRFLALLFVLLIESVGHAQVAAIDLNGLAVVTDDGDGDAPDLDNRGPLMCFSDAHPEGLPCTNRAECISAGLPEDQCALGFP